MSNRLSEKAWNTTVARWFRETSMSIYPSGKEGVVYITKSAEHYDWGHLEVQLRLPYWAIEEHPEYCQKLVDNGGNYVNPQGWDVVYYDLNGVEEERNPVAPIEEFVTVQEMEVRDLLKDFNKWFEETSDGDEWKR